MICLERKLKYNGSTGDFKVTPLGDVHVGNRGTCKRTFHKVVEEIRADPQHYWFGIGDYCDFITVRDKRFRTGMIDPAIAGRDDLINAQIEMFYRMVEPIAGKCLGLIRGNHGDTILTNTGIDVVKMLADKIGTEAMGYEGYFRLLFRHTSGGRGRTIDIFASHGSGSGRKPGAKINRLADIFSNYPADFIIVGHTHDMLSHVSPYIAPDQRMNIRSKHHLGMIASAFLKKHTDDSTPTYIEKKGLPPVAIGHSWITYNPLTDKRGCGLWVEND